MGMVKLRAPDDPRIPNYLERGRVYEAEYIGGDAYIISADQLQLELGAVPDMLALHPGPCAHLAPGLEWELVTEGGGCHGAA